MGREEASQETLDFINIAQITQFVYSLHENQLNHDSFFLNYVIHNTFIQLNLIILIF